MAVTERPEGSAAAAVPLGPLFVPRPRLIRKLEAAPAPVVLLSAPSGYGKSVLVGQWAEGDPRPFESVILGDEHNDPAMLLASIVEALERIEPVSADVSAALSSPDPSIEEVVLPRLCQALAERKVSFVLVLDDLERIESPQCLQAVYVIGTHLAKGSQLALATRTIPALPIGKLRAHRMLTELGRSDLVMTKGNARPCSPGLASSRARGRSTPWSGTPRVGLPPFIWPVWPWARRPI